MKCWNAKINKAIIKFKEISKKNQSKTKNMSVLMSFRYTRVLLTPPADAPVMNKHTEQHNNQNAFLKD